MANKFKIGDRVRVSKVAIGTESSGYVFTGRMYQEIGKVFTVTHVDGSVVFIDAAHPMWGWCSSWLGPDYYQQKSAEPPASKKDLAHRVDSLLNMLRGSNG